MATIVIGSDIYPVGNMQKAFIEINDLFGLARYSYCATGAKTTQLELGTYLGIKDKMRPFNFFKTMRWGIYV
jgi:hypothetical protein